jgi:glutamyl-tRNA synthetase
MHIVIPYRQTTVYLCVHFYPMSIKPRVRFAPSPTGPLHMGGVRTALYNYLFAKKHGGVFILRIEDTDQTRFVQGAEEYIRKALEWCQLIPDESPWNLPGDEPYRQSERKPLYKKYVDQLIQNGHAYYAFDTAEDLELIRERAKAAGSVNWQYNHISRNQMKNSLTLPQQEVEERLARGDDYVVRIKLVRNEEVRLQDIIRGWVSVNTSNMDDKVLFKSDGMPTYHMANVVDDYLMKITHVIRGEEWLPSAPLHVLLYKYLGWEERMPQFAHLPLLLRPDGNGKLSKRDGDRLGFPVFPIDWLNPENGETASGYREQGFYPEAFVNMLAFLGWNPGTDQELYSLNELIDGFSLDRVSKSGAKFDFDKAKWFNQQYLRRRDENLLTEDVSKELLQRSIAIPSNLKAICQLMKERAIFPVDILSDGDFFFNEVQYDSPSVSKKWKPESGSQLSSLKNKLMQLDGFSAQKIEEAFTLELTEKNLSFGQLGPVLRIALTGRFTGPSAFEIAEILGKDECAARIDRAIQTLG